MIKAQLEEQIRLAEVSINAVLCRPKGVAPSTAATCALAKAVPVLAKIQLYKNGA